MCVCLFVYICVSDAFFFCCFSLVGWFVLSWLICLGELPFCFLKRERKVWSWTDEEVEKIWEEMRKEKL